MQNQSLIQCIRPNATSTNHPSLCLSGFQTFWPYGNNFLPYGQKVRKVTLKESNRVFVKIWVYSETEQVQVGSITGPLQWKSYIPRPSPLCWKCPISQLELVGRLWQKQVRLQKVPSKLHACLLVPQPAESILLLLERLFSDDATCSEKWKWPQPHPLSDLTFLSSNCQIDQLPDNRRIWEDTTSWACISLHQCTKEGRWGKKP